MAMPRLPRPPIYDEILENCLCEVRVALNKTSILGGQRFKLQIENQAKRCVSLLLHGGCCKPKTYKETIKEEQ